MAWKFNFFHEPRRKKNEGSNYDDETSPGDKIDNAINPGKIFIYKWQVPERAGPGPNGPTCVTWAYYSDVDPIKDTNSGLVGPLVICKKVSLAIILRIELCQSLKKRDGKEGGWWGVKMVCKSTESRQLLAQLIYVHAFSFKFVLELFCIRCWCLGK